LFPGVCSPWLKDRTSVSGTSRRANEDDLPLLPPLSQPPAAPAAVEAPVTRSRNNPLPGPPPVAPRGIPAADPSRATLPEQVTLSNKFQLARQLATREEELLYQALHTGTGRHVQIHMLPSGVPADGPAAQRMLRAARAAGRVPHPNVLSVVDSGTDAEGRQFIVYEHFSGAAVDELVAKHGPFGARAGAEIMLQVLEALHAMHTRGVVHRNIRPDNVLVEREGGHTRVKLTGFRYALVSGKNTPTPDLPKGYSRYLAPEARRGTGTSEPALDIYAAGVLMRFLLTGETDPGVEIDPKAARAISRATEDDPDERITAENFLSAVGLMIPDEDGGPDSLVPQDPLAADFKYMQQRRERESGVAPFPRDDGRIELFPVLMMIEAIYAAVGGDGWKHMISDVPQAEELLPAAGKGDHFREQGVPVSLVARILVTADAIAGKADLSWLPTIGEAIVKRGIHKFCPTLPRALSPDVLVHCMPVIWSSISRHGEVSTLEHLGTSARIAIRGQVQPSLEVCAVVAGMLRAQLRALVPRAQLNTIASQSLGDAADVFVLTWG
jgi:serine/threonine protein kinase